MWTPVPARGAPNTGFFGADDRARTGDLDLGKVALYQLSYVRVVTHSSPGADRIRHRFTR
jgi:hypothetical protein